MDDEVLDLVNNDDQVIGKVNRKDYNQMLNDKLGFVRASDLFIINSKGEIFIPLRTAHKTIAPNGYDFSAAGHVKPGESYINAVIRETKEELNISITTDDLELITKEVSDDIRYIRCVYLMRSDDTPKYNHEDFVSAEWIDINELIKRIDNGHAAKTNLRDDAILLQDYLRKR